MKENMKIRDKAKKAGVCHWEIAEAIGISEPTFCRKMRREMPDAEQRKILDVIEDIAQRKRDAESDSEADLLEAIFPDGWEGEVDSLFTDPSFMPEGYIKCTDEEE